MSGTVALTDSWFLPQPDELTENYYDSYRTAFPGCYPDEPNTVMCVQSRTHGIVGFGLYLYQRSLADELMVDTARTWLPRHADLWGVPQIPASFSVGAVVFSPGASGSPLPAQIEVVGGDGTQWITTAAGAYGADGTATVPVVAELAGAGGNLPAGQQVTVISPVIGLQNTTAVVAAGGLAGGAPPEPTEAWRGRVLQRIRKRGRAGAVADYQDWAEAAGAASDGGGVNVLPSWVGPGSVGVAFALPNPNGIDRLVPTPAQVTAMQAALDAVRPVTAQVIVLAAVQTAVPVTLALSLDTVANRAAAATAMQAYIALTPIGGLLDRSRLEDAVIQATGSGAEITVPAANVQAVGTVMLTLGLVTPVAYV